MERYQQSRRALGSDVYLTLVSHHPATQVETTFEQLWQWLEDFEERFSRFRATSELSQFNAHTGEPQTISPEFRHLLELATRAEKLSGGIVTPFILPDLQRAGYVGSWPHPATTTEATDYRDRHNQTEPLIALEDDSATIPAGTALDFGGIGKGIALDELANLATASEPNFCFMLGGDLICGGNDLDHSGWDIGVAMALDPATQIGHATSNGERMAVATSGITKRRGAAGEWHHLIDPRTGQPAATDLLTATVTTPSGFEADVIAKTAVILGSDDAATWLTSTAADGWLLQCGTLEAAGPVIQQGRLA